MLTLLSFLFGLAGFAALAVALPRHHRQIWSGPPSARRGRGLRVAGWVLLGLSLPPCLAAWDMRIGMVAWCGLLTAAALMVVAWLAWRARRA